MADANRLKEQIKSMMVENLMLQVSAAEIGDDQPLFGPGGLGLDSVDALQLVVALDKTFGLKIADPETARQILQNVNTIADAVQQAGQLVPPPAGDAGWDEVLLHGGVRIRTRSHKPDRRAPVRQFAYHLGIQVADRRPDLLEDTHGHIEVFTQAAPPLARGT